MRNIIEFILYALLIACLTVGIVYLAHSTF